MVFGFGVVTADGRACVGEGMAVRRHSWRVGPGRRQTTVLAVVVAALLVGASAGCRSGVSFGASEGGRSHRVAGPRRSDSGEASVRPGINEKYRKPDVDVWVGRFEKESREIFARRDRIVAATSVGRGMTVADIGAGTGLFEPLFSKAVGPEGVVLAVDIVPEFLALIRDRAATLDLHNVRTVRCAEDSVTLAPASIDVAFLCDTYHHFEYPRSTMRSIYRALKPGGELVVVDFDRVPGKSRQWILDHVRAGRDQVAAEIVSDGFLPVTGGPEADFLTENFLLRFTKPQ